MKTLKSDIFYAMNEINDKYILEAAQCLEQKKENDISLQKNSKLFHESNAHSRKWLARVATAMAVSIIPFYNRRNCQCSDRRETGSMD